MNAARSSPVRPVRSWLPMAIFVLLVGLCLLPPAPLRAFPRFEVDGRIDAEVQAGGIDTWVSTLSPTGVLGTTKRRQDGLFQSHGADLVLRLENDFGPDTIFDVTHDLRGRFHDPTVAGSRRASTLDSRLEVTLAHSHSERTWSGVDLTQRNVQEEFLPDLDVSATTMGATLDRRIGAHRYLTLRGEATAARFEGDATWDFDETRLRLSWLNLRTERYANEVFPSTDPPDPTRESPFIFNRDLELWRRRSMLRRLGKTTQLPDLLPSPPEFGFTDKAFRPHVRRRESDQGVDLSVWTRSFPNRPGQELLAGSVKGRLAFELKDDLNLELENEITAKDFSVEEEDQFLMDHLENQLRVRLRRNRPGSYTLGEIGLQTLLFDQASRYNYSRAEAGLTWDMRVRPRYSWAAALRYAREFHNEPTEILPDRNELFWLFAFRLHFDERQHVQLSWAHEEESVQGLQTQFDSTFATNGYELRYLRELRGDWSWHVGVKVEAERHQVFYQNNRDESVGFLGMSVHL